MSEETRAVVERAAELLAERLARRMIVPEATYPPARAAWLIGIRSARRAQTIRQIPPELLPYVPITPGGRIVGYLGRDLLAYLEQRRVSG